MFHYLFLLSSIISFISSQQIKFNYPLKGGEKLCLSEYLPEKTTVIYSETTNSTNYYITLKDSQGKEIASSKNKSFNEGFLSNSSDYLELCTHNYGVNEAIFTFQLKYGVGANDYSSVVREKDLRPIDKLIKEVLDQKRLISRTQRRINRYDKRFETKLDSVSDKIILYSVYLIIFMIVVGFFETFALKKFMKRRKII